jgi:predicted ester cyclase
MSVDATTRTVNAYLDTLVQRGDFGQYFTENVVWTTVETGEEIHGREAVRDFIVALHTQFFDAHPELKHVAIGDGIAGLEADFVGVHTGEFAGIPPTGANLRVPYSVFYDVNNDGITALRAYMPVSQMIAELEAARSTAS